MAKECLGSRGPRNPTEFTPRNRPHAGDLLGKEDVKRLPLSGDGDSDRPESEGGLYRGCRVKINMSPWLEMGCWH